MRAKRIHTPSRLADSGALLERVKLQTKKPSPPERTAKREGGLKSLEKGSRYGRWTAERFSRIGKRYNVYWMFHCDCSPHISREVYACNIVSGKSQSCGCLARERTRIRNATHGHCRDGKNTSEYGSWSNARERCRNKKNHAYSDYGGRGIEFCKKWDSFEAFMRDMGPKPSAKHEIDRYPNNDGNYEPGNCRWALRKPQANNTRWNVFIKYGEVVKTAAEWAEETGIKHCTILWRFHAGWPTNKILQK